MPSKPTSKIFLGTALLLLVVGIIVWGIFRSPESNTGGVFSFVGLDHGAGQSSIPHGHGQDTLLNRSLDPQAAPSSHQTADDATPDSICDLFDTGIADDDCDGIPNWLEERNHSDAQNPNNPYLQGGWDHDDDGIFHGMDGHYACDAYNYKLLNCDKLTTSILESITSTQDTDKGGVPDVMEIIKDMNPLDDCDDHDACAVGTTTSSTSDTTSPTSEEEHAAAPAPDVWNQLLVLHHQLEANNHLLDQYQGLHGQSGLDFGTFLQIQNTGRDLQTRFDQLTGLLALQLGRETTTTFEELQRLFESNLLEGRSWTQQQLDSLDELRHSTQLLAADLLTQTQELQQTIALIPVIDWASRHDVILNIDAQRSTWQQGKLNIFGAIDTRGARVAVDLRYAMISDGLMADNFKKYCFDAAGVFSQANIENNTNAGSWLFDIINILNNNRAYERRPVQFLMGVDAQGTWNYTDVVQTNPGQFVPFVVTVDGLDPLGLYAFALVDPTFQIPIPILNLPIHLTVGGVDHTGTVSSFMFFGPSCFNILNRYLPVLQLDTQQSSMTGGIEYTEDGQPIRDGRANMQGTYRITTPPTMQPFRPDLIPQFVWTPLTFKYGPAVVSNDGVVIDYQYTIPVVHYPSAMTGNGQYEGTWNVLDIPNIHENDYFVIVEPVTNAVLLGPVKFGDVREEGGGIQDSALIDRMVGAYQFRWFFWQQINPNIPSALYPTETLCLQAARVQLGVPVPCHMQPVPAPHIDISQPQGTYPATYADDIAKNPEQSFTTTTTTHFVADVTTFGQPLVLQFEYYPVTDSGVTPSVSELVLNGGHPIQTSFNNPTKLTWEITNLQKDTTYAYRIIDPALITAFAPWGFSYSFIEGTWKTMSSDKPQSIDANGTITVAPDFIPLGDGTVTFGDREGLVPCGNPDQPPCDYNLFIQLIDNIIEYIIFLIAPIATICLAYAGFLFMTSADNAAKHGKAKKIFEGVLKGIALILLAWLIVAEFFHLIGLDKDYILLDMPGVKDSSSLLHPRG